jgi:hypothetical protein
METSVASVESLIFRARQNLKKAAGNNFKKNETKPQVTPSAVV